MELPVQVEERAEEQLLSSGSCLRPKVQRELEGDRDRERRERGRDRGRREREGGNKNTCGHG